MISRLLMLIAGVLVATSAIAQVPPRVTDMRGAPPVTPLQWKHAWLSERNTSWDYVPRESRPLVLNLPAAPAEYSNGLDAYMWRLFYDEGYALGRIVWRDSRSRFQSVRQDVRQIRAQISELRANAAQFGGFDPNRIVVAGSWDDAFPAALVAFDSGPRESSPVCATIFIRALNLDPTSPETPMAKRRFSEDSNLTELLPSRYASNAPPTLLLNEGFAPRADKLAEAIRAAGGVAVQATISMFIESDPRTYLGHSEDPSTQIIRDFLKTYCPAKSPLGTQP